MCIRDRLKTINNGTSGTITLNDVSVALTGSTADVKAALDGTFAAGYTGNVTLNDANTVGVAAADISTIAGDTAGTVTVSNNINLTGTAAEITTAVGDVDSFGGTPTATLSNAHTLAQLKTINNAVGGTLTLNDVSVALVGSAADIKAALAGTFAAGYTGNVTINDANGTGIAATDISTIAGATAGTVTPRQISRQR